MIERWREWIAAFDASVADDNWDRLIPFLCDDVVYSVANTPFACELRGRDAVIAGFAKSIRNFDHKFDERHWYGVGIRSYPPNAVAGRGMVRYRLVGNPDFCFSAHGLWIFRGNQLSIMTDVYDLEEADVIAALEWVGQYGEGFDPSYT
jgi:hypothetical protein